MPRTVAIRPPEYFAGLDYLALAQAVDVLVLADTFPYRRRSMQSRARLRTPQGWQWISVPMKGNQSGRPLTEVGVENRERWLVKHWRSFQYNYRSTPYFELYEPDFAPFFDVTWDALGPLACRSVELACELMELPTEVVRASALPGAPAEVEALLDAVSAEQQLGLADREDGPPPEAVDELLAVEVAPYRQNFEGFEAGLSAMDLLFNHGPNAAPYLAESVRRTEAPAR